MKVEVTDSDAQNEEAGEPHKEDLRLNINGRAILVEVKGTVKETPPPSYFVQLESSARRQGLRDCDLCLVLNYDLGRPPQNRKKAYPGKEGGELLKGVYFIDTRMLHALAIDIIKGRTDPEEAREILFHKLGRVEYKQKIDKSR